MKLPKKVIIYGIECKVIENPETNGSNFYSNPDGLVIEIGTKEKQIIPASFLHEVIESTFAENNCRYRNCHNPCDQSDYMFIFNHKEFENMIPQIAFALKDFLK